MPRKPPLLSIQMPQNELAIEPDEMLLNFASARNVTLSARVIGLIKSHTRF